MLRIEYYGTNGQFEESQTLQASIHDYINAFRNAARDAGEPIKVIGPSMQALCWTAFIETRDGSYVRIIERAS